MSLLSTVTDRATLLTTARHTLWGCTVKLTLALTAAAILADAAVTPPSPKYQKCVEWDVKQH